MDLKLDVGKINDENVFDKGDDAAMIRNENEWNLLGVYINFEEYANCDIVITSLKLCTVRDWIDKKLSGANLSDTEEKWE